MLVAGRVTKTPTRPDLQHLINNVISGHGLFLYLPVHPTDYRYDVSTYVSSRGAEARRLHAQ